MRVETFYRELDEVLGGGLIKGSAVSIFYDTYSLGAFFGLHIFAMRIKEGDFGVISNYNFPFGRLVRGAKFSGLDIIKEGKNGNLAVIDVFSSRYKLPSLYPFVYLLPGEIDAETLNPKIRDIYKTHILSKAHGRSIIRLIYSLDGVAFFFGEQNTLKLLYADLAKISELVPNSTTILLTNKDAVSNSFLARISDLSDYVIDFTTNFVENAIIENAMLTKALTPEFAPESFDFFVRKSEEGKHHFVLKRRRK